MIIAIIYVSALLLVMANLAEVIVRTQQNRRVFRASNLIDDLLFSAESDAKTWIARHPPGANGSSTDDSDEMSRRMREIEMQDAAALDIADCSDTVKYGGRPCMGFEVVGRGQEQVQIGGVGASYYSVPSAISENGAIRGTGSAAERCGADPSDADDSCHWNKLRFGESVEIPLYYEDSGGSIRKPADFKLRIRTPACEGSGPDCSMNGRVVLYPKIPVGRCDGCPFRNPDEYKDSTLVQWQINDADGGTDQLVANSSFEPSNRRELGNNFYPFQNTELSGGRINDANPTTPDFYGLTDFVILDRTHRGQNFTRPNPDRILISDKIRDYARPVLRLNFVTRPKKNNWPEETHSLTDDEINDTGLDVPYLEYQLLTSDPVADSKSIIRTWARILDFSREKTTFVEHIAPEGGFVLESL